MNNKIVSIKRNSAIFLAIVLVTGTIALYSSSFMTTASAQSEFYYDTDEYTKYAMDMVNDYEDSSSHEIMVPMIQNTSHMKMITTNQKIKIERVIVSA